MNASLPTIGWIGAGRMGFSLVKRLLNAGYQVSVYNRTRAKAEPLAEFGATIVDTPAELAGNDIVATMVSTGPDLEQVLFGDNGLLSGDQAPRIVVDSSTVSQQESAGVRDQLAGKDVKFLVAAVSGNPAVIDAGKLTVAASGDREVFDEVLPILEAYGRGVTYVGEGELARLVKIAHNVLLGVVTQSLSEIAVLAEKGGVSRAAFFEFLNDSVMGSVFSKYKTPAMVNLDMTPTFTNVLLGKDMELGLSEGRRLKVPMPLTAATAQMVHGAAGAGHVENDFASLIIEQARRSGYEIESENADVTDGLETE